MLLRRLLLIAVFIWAGAMLLAASAQAACDGGTCPILRGGQRTQVSRGLPFPIAAIPLGPGCEVAPGVFVPCPAANTGLISSMRVAHPVATGSLFPGGPPKTGTPAHGRALTNPAAGAVRPIPGAEVNVVKPEGLVVFHHLDPGTPRVKDEPDLEQPRYIAQRSSVREALESDTRTPDTNCFEFGHLGREIGVREADVVHAGPLRATHGRLHDED